MPDRAPPYIPLRTIGWPSRRSPRWLLSSGVVLLVIGVAVGLAHRPTQGERASDLRSVLATMNADVGSCAAGVRESLIVLKAIDTGTSHDLATALSEVNYGASNCSPANNELLDDLTSAQVPESLSSFHLETAITDLITWAAPDAQQVMTDVATALTARGKPTESANLAALRQALHTLDLQRSAVYSALRPAIRALAPQSAPPVLPG